MGRKGGERFVVGVVHKTAAASLSISSAVGAHICTLLRAKDIWLISHALNHCVTSFAFYNCFGYLMFLSFVAWQ